MDQPPAEASEAQLEETEALRAPSEPPSEPSSPSAASEPPEPPPEAPQEPAPSEPSSEPLPRELRKSGFVNSKLLGGLSKSLKGSERSSKLEIYQKIRLEKGMKHQR